MRTNNKAISSIYYPQVKLLCKELFRNHGRDATFCYRNLLNETKLRLRTYNVVNVNNVQLWALGACPKEAALGVTQCINQPLGKGCEKQDGKFI